MVVAGRNWNWSEYKMKQMNRLDRTIQKDVEMQESIVKCELSVCVKLEKRWMPLWTMKRIQKKSLGKSNFKTCHIIYIKMTGGLLWYKLAMGKMRPFYLYEAIRYLISERLNIKIRISTHNYFPRIRTEGYSVTHCIVYNTTYISYQNINRCSISHKSNNHAVWLTC